MRQRIVAAVRRPEFWLACLLGWLLLSASRSLGTPWARAAETEALRWSAGILLFWVLGAWRRGTEMMTQFVVLLVGALAASGIFEGLSSENGGLVGPYHDHQLYGSALLVLLPVSAALAVTAREKAWRWGALAAGTAGVFCLILSQTRSAWAGLLVSAMIFGWLWFQRTRRRPRQGRTLAWSAFILLAGVAAVWMLVSPADLRAPVTTRAATLTNLHDDESWQGRLTAWQGAVRLAEAYPVNGIGLGRYPSTQWAWTHVGRPIGAEARPSLSEEAHDFYLQTTAEIGLIGLGLYVAVMVSFVVLGLHRLQAARRHRSGLNDALVTAALSALAGQLTDGIASPSWQFAETSLFFWAVLGLGFAAMRQKDRQGQHAALPIVWQRPSRLAFAGLACITLTSQFLPLGLLTPVEAYAHAAGITLVSTVLNPASTCQSGYYCFTLTAKYSNGTSQDVTFDNGPGGPSSFGCGHTSPPGGCLNRFGTGPTRNSINLTTADVKAKPLISAEFFDVTTGGKTVEGNATYLVTQ